MTKWKIEYIDTHSNGRRNITYHYGSLTRYEVIKFFGLDKEDVLWFRISIIKENGNKNI